MPPVEHILTPASLRDWPLPVPEGDKSSRGRVLVVGGARTAPGAAMLAGLAALRVGAGVLTLAVGQSVAGPVAAAVPESAVLWLPETPAGSVAGGSAEVLESALGSIAAILIGPGLDDVAETAELITGVVAAAPDDLPIVLDAYAIGALSRLSRSTLAALRGRLVLTPNHSELERLLAAAQEQPDGAGSDGADSDGADSDGADSDGADSDGADDPQRWLAERYAAVLSSDNQIVTPAGDRWQAPAGHSGLGTSGSGDVLAGALVGLLARGVELPQATCWATYLHAAAGDRLAARVGSLGFLARELLDQLPLVLTELQA
ncbi:MAG TPA: ADP/ATP-dependent (S)-NAD(P)H-hydrate dehydratase [Jatrophihabitans sp.]|jgi:NAD(P)H-hydrate repair Nnr-like enzyme with NAD(P)H-hydrate dehydratase domain|uniref:ADP-dependent NAD(P)H-hydrate dehydratase n=1 Tax=Jatrophihabitans sp. TaxID=1932789 RepID=UPI002F010A67